jgi:phage terminase large subunit-like protein
MSAFDPIAFVDAHLPRNEKGQPWTLSRHQRRVLAHMFRRHFPLRLWGEMKKSGKTALAAMLVLAWAFTHASTEIIIAANDLEQSQGRVFRTLVALLQHHPALRASATITQQTIKLTNGTLITAIASDYRGAAGSRHSLVVFDELWGFDSDTAQRLYEELTPPPTEPEAWVLVVTYAGFTGESTLLEQMYQRGLAGTRVDDELEVYESDGLVMFWSHTPRQPWQTDAYYAEQARSLRPNTFARLHRNEWVSGESQAFMAEDHDACTEPAWEPLDPGEREPRLYVGADIGTRSDAMALAAVVLDGDLVILVQHRVWTPTPGHPVDIETTLETTLRQWHRDYTVARILIDPYQAYRSLATLQAAGLPIEACNQTTPVLHQMASVLSDLVAQRRLVLYPDPTVRAHLLNAAVVESDRGLKLAKPTAARKIDFSVALAMAAMAAVEAPVREPAFLA